MELYVFPFYKIYLSPWKWVMILSLENHILNCRLFQTLNLCVKIIWNDSFQGNYLVFLKFESLDRNTFWRKSFFSMWVLKTSTDHSKKHSALLNALNHLMYVLCILFLWNEILGMECSLYLILSMPFHNCCKTSVHQECFW